MPDAAGNRECELVACTELRNGYHITLTNQRKLNCLTLSMIRKLQDALHRCIENRKDARPQAIVLEGAGRAFCAGGDVRSIYDANIHNKVTSDATSASRLPVDYFFEEYILMNEIASLYPKFSIPQVSLWHGIVMGGGVGLSGHGRFRVCCEQTLFAMPETAIGLFPDVGVSYTLCNIGELEIGKYIALTGVRLNAADLMWTGLATHYCSVQSMPNLRSDIIALLDSEWQEDGRDVVEAQRKLNSALNEVFAKYCSQGAPGPSQLSQHATVIRSVFKENTLEGIVVKLRRLVSPANVSDPDVKTWAKTTLDKLTKELSPTSLKVTLRHMQRIQAKQMSLAQSLVFDYRLSQKFCASAIVWPGQERRGDFMEGIRAVLVDKDKAPTWEPAHLQEVSAAHVEDFFEPLPKNHPRGELPLPLRACREKASNSSL